MTTTNMQDIVFSIYRYDPDKDDAPYMQQYTLAVDTNVDTMLLTALLRWTKLPRISITNTIPTSTSAGDTHHIYQGSLILFVSSHPKTMSETPPNRLETAMGY